MKNLSIDLETYSSADIGKTGVYRYCKSPDFEIPLFGYSIDGSPVQLVALTCGERVPDDVRDALSDPAVTKWAFNASFERICLSRWLELPSGTYLEPGQWRCSMIWSAYLGLPMSLAGVGAVLQLDKQKLDTGKDLIRYFCKPCRPTMKNGGRTRNLPRQDPGKWEQFKSYNLRDVETELRSSSAHVEIAVTCLHRVDGRHIRFRQLEVENVIILRNMVGIARTRYCDKALLHLPAEQNLWYGLAVLLRQRHQRRMRKIILRESASAQRIPRFNHHSNLRRFVLKIIPMEERMILILHQHRLDFCRINHAVEGVAVPINIRQPQRADFSFAHQLFQLMIADFVIGARHMVQ